MRRTLSLLLLLAVFLAACIGPEAAPVGPTTTAAPAPPTTEAAPTSTATTPPTTVNAAPSPDITITDCTNEPDAFHLFCEAYEILTANFVDDLDPASLAAGAIEGMQAYAVGVGTAPSAVACAAPTADFTEFCSVYAAEALDAVPEDELIEAAVQGLMDFALNDPNSNYLPPAAFEQFRDSNSGQIEGIGALVRGTDISVVEGEDALCNELSATCKLEIVTPLDGSPAEAAGIQPGDFIVEVNGASVEGQLVDAVVLQVRGPAGTEVLLGIERNGEILAITIERAPIVVPIVTTEMLSDTVGYLGLAQFTATSPDLVDEGLRELIANGAETIIFDLQNNPGGLLDASVEIASEFISEGVIVSTKAPNQVIDFDAIPGGLLADNTNVTVYVLINRGSASASEVVAGALQDTGRAIVVGENSFGKNTVQRQFLLSNGGALKVTIARWITPNGTDYGVNGLAPDIAVELPDTFDPQFLVDYTLDLIEND